MAHARREVDHLLDQPSLVTLADQEIRRLILAGELAPGQRLYEAKLSEQLGISRPPLREALRVLAAQGIVRQTPRQGYRVVELSEQDVDEIYSLRAVLEQFALDLALPALRTEDLAELDTIMSRMWHAARTASEPAIVAANREFHLGLVALARHKRLSHAYAAVMDQMQLCMSKNLRAEAHQSGTLFEGCRRHERLLDAIRTRDPNQVRRELARHGERTFLDRAGSTGSGG
ncbi:MAG TPA: GntR family transcriptional regulator [Amycolatopsis sp.]|nr:GntR family transcriptional regulator [Amycolatopsis sp.]